MEAEFTIPPPAEEPAGAEQHMSNKEKRKLKQQQKQQQQQQEEETAAREAEQAKAEAAAAELEKPLSHKEKRQAKKRRLAAEAAGEDPDAITPAATASASKSGSAGPTMIGGTAVGNTPARSAHGVWVGNMNFATHARELLAWFQARGLSEITRINMPNGKRAHENNRGFAYLDFPTQTDVTIAVGLSEQNLDGRKLLIKASTDYTGRPATALETALSTLPPLDPSALEPSEPSASTSAASAPGTGTGTAAPPQTLNRTARKILNRQKNPPGPTLFLGNLGFETVVDDIRDMFDRNQKRSREWGQKTKEEKKEKKASSKGKKKREEGQDDDEDESEDEAESDSSDNEEDQDDNDDEESSKEDGDEAEATEKKPRRDKQKKEKNGPLDLSKAETAGIRKIRLGTFEDSGKCKGWAFVDFHLPAQATRALLNLHNHTLNGRSLNVEFASAEAVRRGGLGSRAVGRANGAARAKAGDEEGEEGGRPARGGEKRKGRDWDDSDMVAAATAAASNSYYDGPPAARRAPRGDGFGGDRPRREDRPGKGGKGGERAKPGAALAMAQRASEAIVQSTGRKTTFE
ncbi:uncharacterized protein JCM15063_005859 [Sporobolomyces koalae]|uniref:uncharacterized protein n=1 Tax=Sporobolomyces koalae TaxID=500713 RepID=UPI003171D28B